MENHDSGFPYTPGPGNPGAFAFNTTFPNAHCQKCFHSSTLIAALWERISELEGRLYQVSAEKHGVEDVVRSILRLQTISLESHQRPSKQGVRDFEDSSYKINNLNESFESCDTLVELSPIAENSASESLNVIDQPLIDVSEPFDSVRRYTLQKRTLQLTLGGRLFLGTRPRSQRALSHSHKPFLDMTRPASNPPSTFITSRVALRNSSQIRMEALISTLVIIIPAVVI